MTGFYNDFAADDYLREIEGLKEKLADPLDISSKIDPAYKK